MPYWDWAVAPQRFPDVMTWPTVRIYTPTGVKNVTNPLFQYTFLSHPEPESWFPIGGDSDAYYGEQPTTLRQPDANNHSQNAVINDAWFNPYGYQLATMVVCIPLISRDL